MHISKVSNTWILNTQTFSLIKCIDLSALSTLYITHTKPFLSHLDTTSSKFHHSVTGSKHKAASTSTIEISVKAAVLAHPQQGCCSGSSSTRCPSTERSTGWSTGAASPTGALLQVSHDNKNGELLWSVSAVETKHFFAVAVSWKPIGFLVHCYIWGSLALMSPKA